jgi:tetratricopeptide (TPR) repeat protein
MMSAMSIPPRTIRRDIRVFISAVTRELGSVRKLVKKGLEDNDYHAVEQDNFPLDYRDLTEKLRERIDSCDAVVHIAGRCYGAEPGNRPDYAPRRSYTQREYEIAVELGKPIYGFLTGADFPADPHQSESPELQELQEAHRRRLTATGRDYNPTASPEQLDQKIRSLQLKVEWLTDELQQVDQKVAAQGGRLRRWLVAIAIVSLAGLGAIGYVSWRQQVEHRAQDEERGKQERERIAAEAARKEAQTIQQVQQEFAERFLQQLLTDKRISAEDARQRALKELPALVKLPLAEIQSLIDRKIAPRATEASLSSLDRARAALAKGKYDEVFQAADEQKQQGRELAMLEGTAALARFRQSPSAEWNTRALAAFQRAMALADPSSPTEWQAWTDAAVAAAEVLYDLARYSEAEPLLRDCLRLREADGGPNSPGVAVVLNNLAMFLRATNRVAEAESLFRRALAISEKSYGPDHPEVATVLDNLAQLLRDTNRMAEAGPLFRRALATSEKSHGPDHHLVVPDLINLAELLRTTNRLAEAEILYRRALAISELSNGPDHPLVATSLNNLAELLEATNRIMEAEPLLRRALAIWERSLGPGHPKVATALNNLAKLLQATSRLAEAEPFYHRALAIFEQSYDPHHPAVASCLNNLAALLKATNRRSEAEPLFRRALAIDERSYGPDHPNVAIDLGNLARLLQATNRPAVAEPLLARAVRIFARSQRLTGHEHPYLRAVTENYRQLLSMLKLSEFEIAARIEAAREGTERLSPIVPEVERLLGPAKPVADVLTSLDRQYKEQGKPAVYFLKLNEPIAPQLDEVLRRNGDGLTARGVAAFREGAHSDSVVLYEAALDLMADQPGQAPTKLLARMNRAAALRELGLVAQARDELVKLLPELDQSPAADSVTKGRARYHLALCHWRLGDRAAAQWLAEESLAAYDGAPNANPVDPTFRRQSEELIVAVKAGKAPPPLDAIDAPAALEAARARYRAREAATSLPLNQTSAPLLDQVLGPAKSTKEVFDALDHQYRIQGKPPVWFLPLNEPIAPHLDELLGKSSG